MIKQLDPTRYAIDFRQVKRPRAGLFATVFGPRRDVAVDAFAVGEVLRAVLKWCDNLDIDGRLQVWNDFRLFLERRDYEQLRKRAPLLGRQVGPVLEDEVLRLKATYLGTPQLTLLVDEGGEVERGHGVFVVDWNPAGFVTKSNAGEVTVRLDRVAGKVKEHGAKTTPLGGAHLKHPSGTIALVPGLRHVLGRAHAHAGPEHVAIPGATGRINKRQVSVELQGDPTASASVTREPGDTNPVQVNGKVLAPGEKIEVRLPAELLLSDELKLELLSG